MRVNEFSLYVFLYVSTRVPGGGNTKLKFRTVASKCGEPAVPTEGPFVGIHFPRSIILPEPPFDGRANLMDPHQISRFDLITKEATYHIWITRSSGTI